MTGTGQVGPPPLPDCPDLVTSRRLPISQPVTHTFGRDRMRDACEVFAHGPDTGDLKVVPHRE